MTISDSYTSLQLAALASACLGKADFTDVGPVRRVEDLSSASVWDADGEQYIIESAHTPEAATSLIAESQIVKAVHGFVGEKISIAEPVGRYSGGNLSTVLYRSSPARPLPEDALAEDVRLRVRVGTTIAHIHAVPVAELEALGFPVLEAPQVRQRKLNLLDAVASSGKIPPVLLTRWEKALDQAGMWRFNPVAIHGDLQEDRFQVRLGRREEERMRVTHWSQVSGGDPAEDFAWIMSLPASARADVFNAYYAQMGTQEQHVDTHIHERALFNAEFAVAEFLLSALRAKNISQISTGKSLLDQLAERLER